MQTLMYRRPRGRAGFTLIELLVVISIVALMVAILLPALSAARTTAQQIACGANQRQIGIAMAGYASDHDGMAVPGIMADPSPGMSFATGTTVRSSAYNLPLNLGRLVGNGNLTSAETLYCPSDTYFESFPERLAETRDFQGPGDPWTKSGSYAYFQRPDCRNIDLTDFTYIPNGVGRFEWTFRLGEPVTRLSAVNFPARETVGGSSFAVAADNYMYDIVNHSAGHNVLYADGHVAFQRPPEAPDLSYVVANEPGHGSANRHYMLWQYWDANP